MNRIVAAIFHPPMGSTEPETLVDAGRRASTEDLIGLLTSSVDEILVVTPEDSLNLTFGRHDARTIRPQPSRPFHFGETLKRLIADHSIDALLYFGSGAGGLLTGDAIERMVEFTERPELGGLFNNFYSCDFAAIASAPSLVDLDLPKRDNGLGFTLADAGIPCYALPRSIETSFDIDTPTDLVLLRASDRGGPEMRRFLQASSLEHPTLDGICERLTDRSSLVHLSGRIHPGTWGTFEQQVACRTAGIVEGRGLKAYGDARPLLLQHVLREGGPTAFFGRLAGTADAAILDSRPILAVEGRLPPAADRFASDLFLLESIENPRWRAFTQAAAEAPIPVLLGGHSLVSGGLQLLAEACWKGRDLARRLHPEPYTGRDIRT